METKRIIEDRMLGLPSRDDSQKHYMVPDGFLDGLTDSIMSRIPTEEPEVVVPPVHWWVKAKPIVYLAACFVGLGLCFQAVQLLSPTPSSETHAATEAMGPISDEDYASFYAEYASDVAVAEQERELAMEQNL